MREPQTVKGAPTANPRQFTLTVDSNFKPAKKARIRTGLTGAEQEG
jgi:hypothetical protein